MDQTDEIWNGLNDEDFLSIGDNGEVMMVVAAADIGSDNKSKASTSELTSFSKVAPRRRNSKHMPLIKFRYGRLWVSDLSTQLWCEQQMVFSLEPPPKFKTEDFVEPPEVAIGSNLHLARELEIEEAVPVRATSKEDRFAVKVINLMEALMSMISGVATVRREIPVFGAPFGADVFISGVIDELRCDSDKLDFEIVEFKTRATNAMPEAAQAKTHDLQIMLYKKLLDDLINQKLSKYSIARYLNLNLQKPFGKGTKGVASFAKPFNANNLSQLLDMLFSTLKAVPFASSLLIEYAYQRDGSTIGISQVKYDEAWLEYQVNWCLTYWTGQRKPVGVDIEDAWKCDRCCYRPHCSTYAKIKEKSQTVK